MSSQNLLTVEDVDTIREVVGAKNVDVYERHHFADITLGAALELACYMWEYEQENLLAPPIFARWLSRLPLLAEAATCLKQQGFKEVPDTEVFSSPESELCSAPLKTELSDEQWALFQSRFSRSMQERGFTKKIAYAIAGAMAEMAENITLHSEYSSDQAALGVVGYQVGHKRMTFSVADVGQGVLSSLRSNPRWHHLETHADALFSAIWKGATSNPDVLQGDGFQEVHRALAQLNGRLRFRTGDSIITVSGKLDENAGIRSFCPSMKGFQLTISCDLNSNPERVENFYL